MSVVLSMERGTTEKIHEAENNLLGALIALPDNYHLAGGAAATEADKLAAVQDVLDHVRNDDIYSADLCVIYQAVRAISNAGALPDITRVTQYLRDYNADKIDRLLPAMSKLINVPAAATPSQYPLYMDKVLEYARDRHAADILRQYAAAILDCQPEADKEIAAISDGLANLDLPGQAKMTKESCGRGWTDWMTEFNRRYEDGTDGDYVPTGIDNLDELLGGGLPRDMVTVLGGRPSTGKTLLAVQAAVSAAQAGKNVCFFSVEMSETLARNRAMACASGVPLFLIKQAKVEAEKDWDALMTAIERLYDHLYVLSGNQSPDSIAAQARSMQRNQGLDLIVIDYLQLLTCNDKVQNDNMRIQALSRKIHKIAETLHVPILLLSQLNRGCDYGRVKPTLASLRDSGAIEQDADVVLLLNPLVGIGLREGEKLVEVHVAKNRDGQADTVAHIVRDGIRQQARPAPAECVPVGDADDAGMPRSETRRLNREAKIPTAADIARVQ